ncbi:MAG TPA: hypothetical protein DCG51_03205 [Erysipelotrichaceae bacterium]|jgi:hypothetical protein|nr:hypothetical protein [Erysipelotrichaceae bacterium]
MIEAFRCLVKALNEGEIPYYHKLFLSIDEAARYTGIGQNKMRVICDRHPEKAVRITVSQSSDGCKLRY